MIISPASTALLKPRLSRPSICAVQRLYTRYSSTVLKHDKVPDPWHGSYHWVYERAISVATLGLIGAAAVCPSKSVDFFLGIILPIHCHIGFGSVITDYLPARKFPLVNKLAVGSLYVGTLATLYGLYLYNTNDVGITEGVKTIWQSKAKAAPEK